MTSLLFKPTELLDEVRVLQTLAGRFLDPASPFQLEELASEIDGLIAQKKGTMSLEIPRSRPIKTRVSNGEFEPPHKSSSRRVFGRITGIWEIEVSAQKVPDPSRANRKVKPTLLIGFTGLASTEFEVVDACSDDVIACWKMELGDESAPGCFFHTFAPIDRSFPVPRHPNLFPTPMSAIGFSLGELFQEKWEQVVSETADAPKRWRSIQKTRLEKLLKWQLIQVTKTTSSPWCSLKLAKPDNSLFL